MRDREGLVQKKIRAGVFRTAVHRIVRVPADHQNRHAARALGRAQPLDQVDPGDTRKHKIANNDVEWTMAVDGDERALGIVAHNHLVRTLSQDRIYERTDCRVVVGDQYPPVTLHHPISHSRLQTLRLGRPGDALVNFV